MNWNALLYMGLGIVVAAVICLIFVKIIHTDGRKARYDERQMAVRGRGYMYAFYTFIVVGMIPCFLSDSCRHFLGDLTYFAPLLVGITVQISYCIWNDAYLELNLDSKRWMASIFFIGLANLLIGICACLKGIIENGSLKISIINIFMGILCIIVLIEIIIKGKMDKDKEGDDEELEA